MVVISGLYFMAVEGDYIFLIREYVFSVIDFTPVSPHH